MKLWGEVSILVLMESGFLHEGDGTMSRELISFYPCFNGIRVITLKGVVRYEKSYSSFYHCFNGIRVLTEVNLYNPLTDLEFLSLF